MATLRFSLPMVPTPIKPPVRRSFAPSTRFALKAVVSPAAAVVKNSRRLLIRTSLFRIWSNFDCTPRSVSREKIADSYLPLSRIVVYRERDLDPAPALNPEEIAGVLSSGSSGRICYIDVEHTGRCRRAHGEADIGGGAQRHTRWSSPAHALPRHPNESQKPPRKKVPTPINLPLPPKHGAGIQP